MNGTKRTPGEFLTSATVAEVFVSTGLQLAYWANDIAFTDAPFGETWCLETADRMACLSELLNICYKRLPKAALEIVVDLPSHMRAQVQINPLHRPEAEEPASKDAGSTDGMGGTENSIDDFPF